jgi:hypothetical protein
MGILEESAMTEKPPDAARQPDPGPAKDPIQVLVNAIGALPDADRDLVYAWLLRRGFEAEEAGVLAVPTRARSVPVAALLQQEVSLGRGALTQASGQQMVPVRFSSQQHAQLRQWCNEHGFSMATVIRGLVSRFLETQPPGQGQPA